MCIIITNKKKLKEAYNIEKELYIPNCSKIKEIRFWFTNEPIYMIWRFVKLLRKCEYIKNTNNGYISNIILSFYRRRKNNLGMKLGLEIHENCFDIGLHIYHGNIVVNSGVEVGKNCKMHGVNCIGNKAISNQCPKLGDNIELGFGAGIFGDVYIPSGCIIGANSVVLKTPYKINSVLVGIPAKEKDSIKFYEKI